MAVLIHSSRLDRERLAEVSDRDLLTAVGRDDEVALDELIGRKAGPLLQLAFRMVADREEARDVVQLAFVRVWEHRDRYDPRYAPNTWLYRIVTNLAIDHLRARDSRERQSEPLRHHLHAVATAGHRNLADLEQREVSRILEELAAGLSERQRAVFVLRELEGLPSESVAAILGCRPSTVRNHLASARRRLRGELRRRYPEYAAVAEASP
ncbi:MAG: RNA polymerase sigma factor [Thermoanaerobaculia bacterium]